MSRVQYPDGSLATTNLPIRGVGHDHPLMPGPIRGVVLETSTADGIVLCTVLPYAGSGRPLYRVPVAAGGGPHHGSVWTPNPSTVALSDVASASDLDGDHVVVDFLGGRANDPIITGRLPHPKSGYVPAATSTEIPASGVHPAVADVNSVYHRHAGTVTMMDRRGNVVVDTTQAPEKPNGDAQGSSEGAASVIVQIKSAAKLEIRLGSTVLMSVVEGEVKLGANPAMHAMLYEAFKTIFDAHTHATAFGPSGPPATPLSTTCKSPGVLLDAP